MEDVVIVAEARTAIGKFCGAFDAFPAVELGATVIRALLEEAGITGAQVDEVILGQVLTAGLGQNPARQSVIRAGLPPSVQAMTVNKVCGSGLKAVTLAAQAIFCEDAEIVIAGGQENMSMSAHVLHGSRHGFRMGHATLVDSMIVDGLWDVFTDCHMGTTAENVAKEYGVSRQDQDAFACASQNKAEAAQKAGKFKNEITPCIIRNKKGDLTVDTDEYPRHGTTMEALSALRPAFAMDGTVTAGNSAGINDGAAMVMLMSASKASELGLAPMAWIRSYASTGVDPGLMGMGPVSACALCLKKAGWTISDLDLMEINEAFAAQAIAVNRAIGWDATRVNVNGGALAIGHPIGASGARILVTLLHEMRSRNARRGLVSLCIGGGMGMALAVER